MLTLPSSNWSDQTQDLDEKIVPCRMTHTSEQLKITHSLSINADLSWSLFVKVHNYACSIDTCILHVH